MLHLAVVSTMNSTGRPLSLALRRRYPQRSFARLAARIDNLVLLIVFVQLRDFGTGSIAGMYDDTVAETHGLPRLQRNAAIALLVVVVIVLAENIHREQAVIAGVPVGRVLRIRRVIEDRDAELLAIELARVIDPWGWFSPNVLHRLAARRILQ